MDQWYTKLSNYIFRLIIIKVEAKEDLRPVYSPACERVLSRNNMSWHLDPQSNNTSSLQITHLRVLNIEQCKYEILVVMNCKWQETPKILHVVVR